MCVDCARSIHTAPYVVWRNQKGMRARATQAKALHIHRVYAASHPATAFRLWCRDPPPKWSCHSEAHVYRAAVDFLRRARWCESVAYRPLFSEQVISFHLPYALHVCVPCTVSAVLRQRLRQLGTQFTFHGTPHLIGQRLGLYIRLSIDKNL